MSEYKIGDSVGVEMPAGWRTGRIVAVLKNYSWSDETKYEIHGDELVTITSARLIRKEAEQTAICAEPDKRGELMNVEVS